VRSVEVCQPANFNGGGQIVISGHKGAVARAVELCKKRGAQRVVELPVSAPFHCPLMEPAAERVKVALTRIEIGSLAVPVVANVDAAPNRDRGRVVDLLVRQVTAPVQWEQSIERLATEGVTRAFEVGPGAVLRGLVRRIAKDIGKEIEVHCVGEPRDVREVRL
jgi:[acyl-carrier-protein] S-malonyltransferase